MPRRKSPQQLALAECYAGLNTGLASGRAAGYTGSDNAVRVQVSKSIRIDWIRARILERGVELPESTAEAAARVAALQKPRAATDPDYVVPDDPAEFHLAVQRGLFVPTSHQMKSVERREQMQRRAASADDGADVLGRLHSKIQRELRKRRERERRGTG